MKSQIPGGIPGIFPFVRHGEDVFVIQMLPVTVSSLTMSLGRRRAGRIAAQPCPHVVMIELLAPQKTREGLPLNIATVLREAMRRPGGIEFVSFLFSRRNNPVEFFSQHLFGRWAVRQPQSIGRLFPRRNQSMIMRGRLGPDPLRVDGVRLALDDIVVKRIFHVWRSIRHAP